ncbi:MAG TPA: hypothetical protein PK514_08485 [Spirochaetota bacterium]|nr:hypothetical protein [Spirochaetota bacterium]
MQLEQIQIEYRVGLFLSVIAFVLSIATGFIAGIPFGTVILRGIIFAVVFFAVGYGGLQILKKLVPEVYEAITSPQLLSSGKDEAGSNDINAGMDEADQAVDNTMDEEATGSGFTEFTEKDFDRYNTPADAGRESTLNPAKGKMGKHIMVQQQFNAYEPKIMAQAIKTMMSKDKD